VHVHVIEAVGITKSYRGVAALAGCDLRLAPGSVHALLGENGAGKSTLVKILTGVIPQDAGQILLDGQPVTFHDTADAARHGIAIPEGPVLLLTHLRYLGYCFNPVSFFYCFDRAERLRQSALRASLA
jgi:ABC-type sugar transport system ATPase subunit